jgi:hypothetical protein
MIKILIAAAIFVVFATIFVVLFLVNKTIKKPEGCDKVAYCEGCEQVSTCGITPRKDN